MLRFCKEIVQFFNTPFTYKTNESSTKQNLKAYVDEVKWKFLFRKINFGFAYYDTCFFLFRLM